MTPPNNQSQEVLRECPFCGVSPNFNSQFVWCRNEKCFLHHRLVPVGHKAWNARYEPKQQNLHKHCSTCKHFKRIYPENRQLGICEYLEVTNLQPCGHMIDRPPIETDKFVPAKGYNICVNRMMDSFGCVYHCPKEGGGDVEMPFQPDTPMTRPEQQSVPSKGDSGLKPAEEWYRNIPRTLLRGEHVVSESRIIDFIKQIQLNAYKAGMSEAAEICDGQLSDYTGADCSKLILSTRDRKEKV